jgi:glutathione S-transferase
MVILYGHPESGHTYKVALSLALMGEPFDYRWVDVFAERSARDPEFQRASRFGEIPVLVDESIAYAQSNAILLHIASKYGRLGGESPALVGRGGGRRLWVANSALEWLRARMHADFNALDGELATQPYLLGNDVTVADAACSAYLLYEDIGLELARWPAMHAWIARIRALPHFKDAATLLRKPG